MVRLKIIQGGATPTQAPCLRPRLRLLLNQSNRFVPGALVRHSLFHYRGVVLGVDLSFKGTDEWYQTMARTRPPKDKPWYHVLVDNARHSTYVAEQNLDVDRTKCPVHHPLLDRYFEKFKKGRYSLKVRSV